MALLPGSAAIGAGTAITGVTTDQRGLSLRLASRHRRYHFQAATLSVNSIAPVVPAIRTTPVASVMFTLDRRAGPADFGTSALTLSDDRGPNLIDGDVSVTLVSGSTT